MERKRLKEKWESNNREGFKGIVEVKITEAEEEQREGLNERLMIAGKVMGEKAGRKQV